MSDPVQRSRGVSCSEPTEHNTSVSPTLDQMATAAPPREEETLCRPDGRQKPPPPSTRARSATDQGSSGEPTPVTRLTGGDRALAELVATDLQPVVRLERLPPETAAGCWAGKVQELIALANGQSQAERPTLSPEPTDGEASGRPITPTEASQDVREQTKPSDAVKAPKATSAAVTGSKNQKGKDYKSKAQHKSTPAEGKQAIAGGSTNKAKYTSADTEREVQGGVTL